MKSFSKILSAVLLAAMLLLSFSACIETPPTSDGSLTTPSDTSTETGTQNPASNVKLIENGATVFKLYKPDSPTLDERDLLEDFVSSFKSKTGVTLEYVMESDAAYENDGFEILIGDTERKEGKEILSSLRENEYFYGVVGNKIVISGKGDFALEDAVQFFLRKVIDSATANDKANITLSSDINYYYRFNYPIQDLTIGGASASDYSIVYSKSDYHGAYIFAQKLATLIRDFTGLDLPIITDDKDETQHEIVVGITNRGTQNSTQDSYSVICKDQKLYLNSSYSAGYEPLYSYIQKTFSRSGDTLSFENGFSYEEALSNHFENGTENMLDKGGSIRVMFNNVLIHDLETAPATWRAKHALDVYKDYAPDVIGLQEMQGIIRTAVASGLQKMGYVEVPYTEKNSNFSFVEDPVFYNPNTVRVITSGAYRFDESLDRNKCIGWALFEEIATGKRFIVASTHYAWLEDAAMASSLRIQHANQTVTKLQELASRYNVPIIIGGDFNSNIGSTPNTILKNGGLVDVETLAIKTEMGATHHNEPVFDLDTKICKTYSRPAGDHYSAIDHIFTYNQTNVTFNVYDVVEDWFALAASDHCPLLVDFTIN